jgi:hypothetical protein
MTTTTKTKIMKTKFHLIKTTFITTILFSAAAVTQAQFSYNAGVGQAGDVLVCFRPNSGSYDLVADAGPVSAFTSLSAGQSITIDPAYYTGSFLSYVGTNNISWSVLVAERLPGSQQANLWLTRPRTNNNVQSAPWPEKNESAQATAASQIDAIGNDAANIAQQVTTPFGVCPASSSTSVVEPEGGSLNGGSDFNSYSFMMSTLGNLGGNFWGDQSGSSVEQSTPANFTSGTQTSRADFYQLNSTNSSGNATYLGYFDLATNGVLTFTAGSVITSPTITSIVSSGTTNVITFTTVPGENYSLLATNSAGLTSVPRSSWPVVGGPVAGTGSPMSITNTSTDNARFYTISAN